MEQRSIRELALNEELFQLRQQLRKLNAQALRDAATIAELKLIVENMKNTKNKGFYFYLFFSPQNILYLRNRWFYSVFYFSENISDQLVIPKKEVRMVE